MITDDHERAAVRRRVLHIAHWLRNRRLSVDQRTTLQIEQRKLLASLYSDVEKAPESTEEISRRADAVRNKAALALQQLDQTLASARDAMRLADEAMKNSRRSTQP